MLKHDFSINLFLEEIKSYKHFLSHDLHNDLLGFDETDKFCVKFGKLKTKQFEDLLCF